MALILSWMKSAQYGLSRGFLMLWTAVTILSLVFSITGGVMYNAIVFDAMMKQHQQQMDIQFEQQP